MLALEFSPVQVWSPNCPGFCDSIVCSGHGDGERRHGLRKSNLALQPVVGVLLQPMAGKAGDVFSTPLMNNNRRQK